MVLSGQLKQFDFWVHMMRFISFTLLVGFYWCANVFAAFPLEITQPIVTGRYTLNEKDQGAIGLFRVGKAYPNEHLIGILLKTGFLRAKFSSAEVEEVYKAQKEAYTQQITSYLDQADSKPIYGEWPASFSSYEELKKVLDEYH